MNLDYYEVIIIRGIPIFVESIKSLYQEFNENWSPYYYVLTITGGPRNYVSTKIQFFFKENWYPRI